MRATTRLLTLAVCAIVGACASAAAHAGNIPLTDPMFSMPAQPSLTAQYGGVVGWVTPSGNAGVLNYTATSGSPTNEGPYWPTVPAGTTFAFSNGGNFEQITTDPSGVITAGVVYQLLVNAGQGIGVGTPTTNVISLISADGTVLKTATIANSLGSFSTETLTYTAPLSGAAIGQQIGILLGSNGVQSSFDNAVLASVPEPSTCVLAGLGLVGLFVAASRRRKASVDRIVRKLSA